jgi:hypothetical protein
VTYPGEKLKKGFLRWSYCNGRPTQVKNAKKFQRGEKYKDFSKWSCCNGRPAQIKILEEVRNARISQNVFIVLGNQPKMEDFKGGEKCKDFSKKWFHCNGQLAQMEDEKSFQRGLIVMGDLPG